jgi:hypothetical protein
MIGHHALSACRRAASKSCNSEGFRLAISVGEGGDPANNHFTSVGGSQFIGVVGFDGAGLVDAAE